jgi:hypothetical protein
LINDALIIATIGKNTTLEHLLMMSSGLDCEYSGERTLQEMRAADRPAAQAGDQQGSSRRRELVCVGGDTDRRVIPHRSARSAPQNTLPEPR